MATNSDPIITCPICGHRYYYYNHIVCPNCNFNETYSFHKCVWEKLWWDVVQLAWMFRIHYSHSRYNYVLSNQDDFEFCPYCGHKIEYVESLDKTIEV